MAEYAKLPKIGLTMKVGTVTSLIKKVGDEVKKGEVLATFETDKISGDIESPIDGTILKVLAQVDDVVEVLEPIYLIGNQGEEVEAKDNVIKEAEAQVSVGPEPVKAEEAETMPQAPAPASMGDGWIKAMPYARSYADENKVDLSTVKPSNRDGIIRKKDVDAALESIRITATPLAKRIAQEEQVDLGSISGTGTHGKVVKDDVLNALTPVGQPSKESILSGRGNRRKIPAMRKSIAERLSFSKQTIPHTYFKVEVDATSLLELKDKLKEEYTAGNINRITLNDLLLKAVVMTLKKYPVMYSQIDGDELVTFEDINLGIAVTVENGLIVPVVHKANRLSVSELANTAAALIDKARKGQLAPEEFTGGNFTVSNLGTSDIDEFYAIINPPEAAILAISKIKDKVVAEAGQMVIRPMMNITLSVDHRLIDGAMAAEFLKTLKNNLQNAYIAML